MLVDDYFCSGLKTFTHLSPPGTVQLEQGLLRISIDPDYKIQMGMEGIAMSNKLCFQLPCIKEVPEFNVDCIGFPDEFR